MRTVEIDQPASHAALFLGALRSSAKRPGAVTALPEVTYVRPRVVLEAARIARYAKVCGFSEGQGVPVTYPQVLTFPLVTAFLGSADCPWPALGTVHLINRIAQHQPLRPGDALRAEVCTGRLIAHEKGQIFTLEMKILRDDEVVWDGTQSLLRLGVRDPAGPAYASGLETRAPLSRQADFSAGSDIGRRYGHATGDLNPIHLSALSAKLFGFRRAIAHGMWTKARALAALLPRAAVAEAEVTVEFKTPLFLPARPSLWTAREPQGVFFEVRDAGGEKPHLRGRLGYRPI
jgi:acyl dehydratase